MTESPEEAVSQKTQSPEEAVTDEYAADVWGQSELGTLHDLIVPSGQKCLVLRPGVQGLLGAGILHNVDGLTALVEKHINKKRGRPQDRKRKGQQDEGVDVDVEALMKDEKSLVNILEVVDKAVIKFMVKPAIHAEPDDSTKRVKGKIYVNMVDLNDRFFIFNYLVGGSSDLDQFRDGLQETMGSLETLEGVQQQAE